MLAAVLSGVPETGWWALSGEAATQTVTQVQRQGEQVRHHSLGGQKS